MDILPCNPWPTVEAAIVSLRDMDLRTAYVHEIEKQLSHISRGWVTTGRTFYAHPDSLLTRARVCNRLPEHLSEIGPPPADVVSSFGRANFPRQTVLYASMGRNAPFFEVDARVGDKVVLSVWEIAKPLTLLPMGYIPEVFQQNGSERELPSELASIVHTPQLQLLHHFLNEQFCRIVDSSNSHEYKISATFAQMAYRSKKLHGILYPSLAMFANGDNVALRRDVISRGIVKLRWIEWIEITAREDKKYSVKTLLHAERFNRGRICWDEISPVILGPGEMMRVTVRNGRPRFEKIE